MLLKMIISTTLRPLYVWYKEQWQQKEMTSSKINVHEGECWQIPTSKKNKIKD